MSLTNAQKDDVKHFLHEDVEKVKQVIRESVKDSVQEACDRVKEKHPEYRDAKAELKEIEDKIYALEQRKKYLLDVAKHLDKEFGWGDERSRKITPEIREWCLAQGPALEGMIDGMRGIEPLTDFALEVVKDLMESGFDSHWPEVQNTCNAVNREIAFANNMDELKAAYNSFYLLPWEELGIHIPPRLGSIQIAGRQLTYNQEESHGND